MRVTKSTDSSELSDPGIFSKDIPSIDSCIVRDQRPRRLAIVSSFFRPYPAVGFGTEGVAPAATPVDVET
jgi:hypothetical protein